MTEVYIMINRSARVCVAIGTKMAPDDKFYLLLRLPLGIDQVRFCASTFMTNV